MQNARGKLQMRHKSSTYCKYPARVNCFHLHPQVAPEIEKMKAELGIYLNLINDIEPIEQRRHPKAPSIFRPGRTIVAREHVQSGERTLTT